MMEKTELVISPHKHDGSTVQSVMLKVVLALVPGIASYVWYFGFAVLIQSILAILFAISIEFILLKLRSKSVRLFVLDGSAVVTALLFALMITPYTPWWISLTGLAFGLIFAKHLYGGLGQNLFNPAVTAYIFVLLCFPLYMNSWPGTASADETGTGTDAMEYIFSSPFAGRPASIIDGVSGATPLADMKNRLASMAMISEFDDGPVYGKLAGRSWEWINMAYLFGGIGLLVMGVISWRIPVSVLGSMFLISLIFNMYNPDTNASAIFHLFAGGTVLGAFFIATDPVSASSTPRGQLIYGCLIGLVAYSIRTWGAYPDGVAFAVLISNGFVPLIDKYTRPRVMGEI